ncbi:MAG: hypothetical protein HY216_01365, partial [Candidatus Rokubacteria bacterium]|nr:hypothetical protein [Candidatus Rokubacteria bacterium]
MSSVDSGNLAGHLIVLAHACLEMSQHPVIGGAALAGLADTAVLIGATASANPHGGRLDDGLEAFLRALARTPETPAAWASHLRDLDTRATTLTAAAQDLGDADVLVWAEALRAGIQSHARDVELVTSARSTAAPPALVRRLTHLADTARAMVAAMDFGFLFDPMRQLFALGYRVADGSLDPGRYDLLASEARLTSFVAIAKGDVPVSHWFRLGRALTPVGRDSVLVSWSGSMFEYLMPGL